MTNALKKAVTGQVATKADKPQTLGELLMSDKVKHQFAAALPKHLTPDRFARVALTEIRKNPKLAEAHPASFMGAIMQAAQLGLEPGGLLGHCYLLPFENRKKGIVEVQFILGYKGMLDLARRSGQIVSIEARTVHAQDKFHVAFGLESDLKHEPNWEADDRGELRLVYAVAKLQGGGVQFDVMGRKEVERVRNESQGYKTAVRFNSTNPWISNFDEMAKKTVIRRLFKYLPISVEFQRALNQDEAADMGLDQDLPLVIDSDTGEITGGPLPPDQAEPAAQADEGAPAQAEVFDAQ